MNMAMGQASTRARRWNLLPWLILLIGIAASAMVFTVVRQAIEDVARLRFERQARDAVAVIDERIQFYSDILYGLRALFASQGPVNRLQFHRFVQSLDLKQRFPGFDVVNYAVYVRPEDKHRFEESVRNDKSLDPRGYPEFRIKPPGNRPGYYVLAYVEPMTGFEFAFGRDLGANPDAADAQPLVIALESARDSGRLTASGVPIRIKARGGEYVGLAMRLAVYRSGMPVGTIEQRRAAYLGSIGAGFNVEDLMRGVLDPNTMRSIRLQLYDVGVAGSLNKSESTEWLLFDSHREAQTLAGPTGEDRANSPFKHDLSTEVGGRAWKVQFTAPKEAIIGRLDSSLPWIVLVGGLVSSALLFGMFYSLASSRSRAMEIANEMTRDLRASTEQLQAMSRQLVDVQESERRQIARELHDRVGQNLTALSINLDIMKTQIGESGDAALRTRLSDAATLLESTAGSIENVMSELRPPMLDDYGLLPALQWYGDEFWRRTGIRVSVEGDEQMERAPQTTEIALFRIAQEALNNVAKHAHASHADIALARNGSRLVMTVSDDGMGFDAAPAMASRRRRPGLGMVTMRERTQAVGGEFEIGPAPDRGARVVVRVPC
jgi:signal transduction histidine kinase/CHASE1-domain containing sensor protein